MGRLQAFRVITVGTGKLYMMWASLLEVTELIHRESEPHSIGNLQHQRDQIMEDLCHNSGAFWREMNMKQNDTPSVTHVNHWHCDISSNDNPLLV